MAQITTTNRQAILELISQADETTEVAGLSASVTQLQIDVAGLSASIGNEINLGDFIVVDVPSGIATFSSTVGDITDSLIISPDSNIANSTFKSEDTNTGVYSQLVMTSDNPSFETINGLDSVSLTLSANSAVMAAGDSIGTQSTIEVQSPTIQLQSTDGTNTSTIDLANNGSITSTSTDGTNTTTQNIGPTGFDMTTTDGANSVAFVADYSQFNIELYDDNVGTTANIGVDTSQSSMGANDGTGTASSIVVQSDNIAIQVTDGTTTLTNINNVNNGVDWQHTNGTDDTYVAFGISNIQLTNTDGTNTSQILTSPTTIDLSSTDGTTTLSVSVDVSSGYTELLSSGGTNTSVQSISPTEVAIASNDGLNYAGIDLDPSTNNNGNRFYSDSPSISSSTGILLAPDQSYQWGGDYNYSGTTYSENYVSGQEQYLSTITDNKISQITLDPASLNTGTLFKSEDLSVGSSAILSLGYDGNSSFDMVDGVGGSSNLTFTPTTILMSATDGSTFTSTLEIDPLEAGNFTNLSTSDGTTVNKLQVSQGDAILSSAYGTTQSSVITQPASIELTSTDGLTTNSIFIQPGITIFDGIPSYDDDAAAGTAGLTPGTLYQTTGSGASPLNVAGILMIKQ